MAYDDFLAARLKTSPEEDARLAEQAKTFPITKVPYRGERRDLKFDRRTHSPLRRSITSLLGDKQLSYSDILNGMHINVRATAHEMRMLYTPGFSANDEQLRLALAQQTFMYVCSQWGGIREFFGGQRVPQELVDNREQLEKLAAKALKNARLQNNLSWNHFQHITWCERHGGYLAMRASIAYKAWRLSKDSFSIAEEMGMNPVAVRQILARTCWAALRLGLETFPPHHSCFRDRPKPPSFDVPRRLQQFTPSRYLSQIPIADVVEQLCNTPIGEKRFVIKTDNAVKYTRRAPSSMQEVVTA